MRITPELVQEFAVYLTELSCSKDTVTAYKRTVEVYVASLEVSEVNSIDFFRDFKRTMQARGCSLNTVARHVFGLKKFLVFVNDIHGVPIVDTSRVRCKHPPAHDVTFLEREEVAQLRTAPVVTSLNVRDRALFEFLLDTGCRISEVVALNVQDLDFETGTVQVEGKGRKRRTVYFNGSKGWLYQYTLHIAKGSPLFRSRHGERWDRHNASIAIRHLGKAAGLKRGVHPHLLRHTYGTYLIRSGVDPKTVQMMMGHEDLETTLKYYVGVNQDQMKSAHAELALYLKAENEAPEVIHSSPQTGMI